LSKRKMESTRAECILGENHRRDPVTDPALEDPGTSGVDADIPPVLLHNEALQTHRDSRSVDAHREIVGIGCVEGSVPCRILNG